MNGKRKPSGQQGSRKKQKKRFKNDMMIFPDPDFGKYIFRVIDALQNNTVDDDARGAMIENVLEEIKTGSVPFHELCCRPLGSRLLDALSHGITADQAASLLGLLTDDLRRIFQDKYGSISLERLLERGSPTDDTVFRVIKFAVANLELASHHHASFPLRRALKILFETPPQSDTMKVCEEVHERLTELGNLQDMSRDSVGAGFLVSYLDSAAPVLMKPVQKFIAKLLNLILPGMNLELSPTVRVVEKCLLLATEKRLTQAYATHLLGRLEELSLGKASYLIVQALITSSKTSPEFPLIFQEMNHSSLYKKLIQQNQTGPLASLSSACISNSELQPLFLKELSLGILTSNDHKSSDNKFPLVEYLDLFKSKGSVNKLHASLILQDMLAFNKPTSVLNAISQLSDDKLVEMISDQNFCFVVEKFMSKVGKKQLDKFVAKLLSSSGLLVRLCCTKFGSRVFDKIWNVSSPDTKAKLLQKLSPEINNLNRNQFGCIVVTNTNLAMFKQDRVSWNRMYAQKSAKIVKDLTRLLDRTVPIKSESR